MRPRHDHETRQPRLGESALAPELGLHDRPLLERRAQDADAQEQPGREHRHLESHPQPERHELVPTRAPGARLAVGRMRGHAAARDQQPDHVPGREQSRRTEQEGRGRRAQCDPAERRAGEPAQQRRQRIEAGQPGEVATLDRRTHRDHVGIDPGEAAPGRWGHEAAPSSSSSRSPGDFGGTSPMRCFSSETKTSYWCFTSAISAWWRAFSEVPSASAAW